MIFVGSTEAPSKVSVLFFQLAEAESSQKSKRMWFFRHFSCYICSTETIGMTSVSYPGLSINNPGVGGGCASF